MRRNDWARILVSLSTAATLAPKLVYAYEVDTHMEISLRAARQSRIDQALPSLGLISLKDRLSDIQTTLSIEDWIAKGAHDEDDTLSTNLARYRNHFYDPQNGGVGYSYLGVPAGEPSPDWGLEDRRNYVTQAYSLKRARQYFYDALTLQNAANREMWMARTFYTLGHVIHLIQDVAQPQHTRNDSHGGGAFGPHSRYEKHTDLDDCAETYASLMPLTTEATRLFLTVRANSGQTMDVAWPTSRVTTSSPPAPTSTLPVTRPLDFARRFLTTLMRPTSSSIPALWRTARDLLITPF